MSKKKEPNSKQIILHLDIETAVIIDQYMFQMGLESRGACILALVRTAIGAVPVDSMEFAMVRESLRNIANQEFSELADFFEKRAALLRPRDHE